MYGGLRPLDTNGSVTVSFCIEAQEKGSTTLKHLSIINAHFI